MLFRGRHFEDVIILLCVRWYLRYSPSYRDLEEIMAERGLANSTGSWSAEAIVSFDMRTTVIFTFAASGRDNG